MEREDQTLKDALDTDPDLLDFNLDDNSLGESALADAGEDEIIELVDVIKKGKYDPDRYGDTREFRHLFDEDISSVKKTPEVGGSKIKWAKEFEEEEEEEEEESAPSEIHAATLEIRKADLIYDEEDHSTDDAIDITERDLMPAAVSEDSRAEIRKTGRGEDLLERDENIPVLREGDLEKELSALPEVPLDDLMDLSVEKAPKPKTDEEISESDLEEVLEGASTDEISLDFQEEVPKPSKPATAVKEPEAEDLNLEEELEKALEEAAVEGEEKEKKIEQEDEDLEKSLQKLFEDEDEEEEPLVKKVQSKPKPAPIPKEEKVPKADRTKEKPEISQSALEALITREVRAAVEKVARETMSSVAEKFIVEAINSLKKSLDSSSD